MRSLRAQISLAIMLVVLFTVGVISFLSNLVVNRAFESYMAKQQRTKAESIAATLGGQYDSRTRAWNIEYIHGVGMYALLDGYIVKVLDPSGHTVWDAENHDMSMCMQIMHEIARRMEARRPKAGGGFVSHEYTLSQGDQAVGSVSIRYYGPYFLSENDFRFLDTLNAVLISVGAVSLLFSLAVGTVLGRRIARPIAKTADIAKQIARGNYAIRFEGQTKTKELDDLVLAINHLAGALFEQEQLRKQLAIDVAHELRTPLTTLGMHLEAMIEGVWEPTPERLTGCYEEIERLTGLIADLERLTAIESDALKLHKAPVNLLDMAQTVASHFEMEIKKKGLTVSIAGDPVHVFADRDRISQVVTNLLSNAVKYTRENGNIRIAVKDAGANGVMEVEDDGIGIPRRELALIFERFYRTDKSRNRETGGAGIGLAIVKSIVTAHGGTVEAQSRLERGSRFTVSLPKR